MNALGVIPARGGSKGIPRKNIRILGDRPLIEFTIRAASESKSLTRSIVSTDDPEIAQIARDLGADVPFLRPSQLATDDARAIPILQHALAQVEQLDSRVLFDVIVMLQPTTPYRNGDDIDGALRVLQTSKADSVISVTNVEGHHPARMKFLEDGRLIDPPFCEEYENQPRQELRPMYIRNGAIYAVRREVLLANSLKGKDSRAWIMSGERSVNIDDAFDWQYAEWLFTRRSP